MSLYLKYRPNDFNEVIGNREIVSTLKGMMRNKETFPHTFLFYGPTGCGKTTFARIVAKKLNCTDQNIVEVDTAQFRGIDTVREIRRNAQFRPLGGGIRVFIIDEVHKMTTDAQNAFLKILEDTPKDIYFILCTTNEKSLLPTIRGRCSQFQVSLLNNSQMELLLTDVTEKENESISNEVLSEIVKSANGHPRNALTILEQVFAIPEKRRLRFAKQAIIEEKQSIDLCRALLKRESWSKVKTILKGLKGQDEEGIRRVVMGYATNTLLGTNNSKIEEAAAMILEEFVEPFYNSGFPGLVAACYFVINGKE
jgi:DNA polymerase III gamma/tau subunit